MDKTLKAYDLAGFVIAAILLALAALGMCGIAYHCLAPTGWLTPWLGHMWTTAPLIAAVVSIGLVAMVLTARNHAAGIAPSSGPNELPLYVFVAFGTVFAFRLIVYGTL